MHLFSQSIHSHIFYSYSILSLMCYISVCLVRRKLYLYYYKLSIGILIIQCVSQKCFPLFKLLYINLKLTYFGFPLSQCSKSCLAFELFLFLQMGRITTPQLSIYYLFKGNFERNNIGLLLHISLTPCDFFLGDMK